MGVVIVKRKVEEEEEKKEEKKEKKRKEKRLRKRERRRRETIIDKNKSREYLTSNLVNGAMYSIHNYITFHSYSSI
jgi:hypothetical protein